MVITKNMLICLLGMDLELEYSSAVQHINHAAQFAQATAYQKVSKEIVFDAMEEIQHAVMLSNEIARLKGYFNNASEFDIQQHYRRMLCRTIDEEEDTIRRYQVRIQQAEQLNEFELTQQLQLIRDAEEEHLIDFKYDRLIHKKDRAVPVVDIFDYDQFSEKWADRALHVPIRKKK